MTNFIVMFSSWKILRKEKNIKKNYFLLFDIYVYEKYEKKIKYN